MRNGMIEYPNGSRYWYQYDQLHRVDGPAIERADGSCEWWVNGRLHRVDGPAVDYGDGDYEWWLNDVEYTERQFKQAVLVYKWGLSVDSSA